MFTFILTTFVFPALIVVDLYFIAKRSARKAERNATEWYELMKAERAIKKGANHG